MYLPKDGAIKDLCRFLSPSKSEEGVVEMDVPSLHRVRLLIWCWRAPTPCVVYKGAVAHNPNNEILFACALCALALRHNKQHQAPAVSALLFLIYRSNEQC
jgi:hypothetical protein